MRHHPQVSESISVAELQSLSPQQFAQLPVEQLHIFTKDHMAVLTDAQLAQMTDEKLGAAWTVDHLNALTPAQGVSLGKAVYKSTTH